MSCMQSNLSNMPLRRACSTLHLPRLRCFTQGPGGRAPEHTPVLPHITSDSSPICRSKATSLSTSAMPQLPCVQGLGATMVRRTRQRQRQAACASTSRPALLRHLSTVEIVARRCGGGAKHVTTRSVELPRLQRPSAPGAAGRLKELLRCNCLQKRNTASGLVLVAAAACTSRPTAAAGALAAVAIPRVPAMPVSIVARSLRVSRKICLCMRESARTNVPSQFLMSSTRRLRDGWSGPVAVGQGAVCTPPTLQRNSVLPRGRRWHEVQWLVRAVQCHRWQMPHAIGGRWRPRAPADSARSAMKAKRLLHGAVFLCNICRRGIRRAERQAGPGRAADCSPNAALSGRADLEFVS